MTGLKENETSAILNGFRVEWNHPHDIPALLEVFVMDVYR